jgi:general secretion pathway protein D
MITIIRSIWIQSMKRISILTVALVAFPVMLPAQETAAGGQQQVPPVPVPTNQPSGLLTPPPDNATAVAPAPAATPTPATPPAPDTAAVVPPTTPGITTSGPPPKPVKMSRQEIARVQEQEIIRRQEVVFRANESLKAGRKAEVATQYPEARKDYLFSAEAYGSISRSTDSYATAAEGLTRVDFVLYDDALKIGDTARAKRLMDEVVKYNPNNQEANKRLAEINRAIANPNDTSLFGNPAVTPGFVKQVNEVQQLFAEAEQFRRTGQWDEAEARLKRILGIDSHNIAAAKQLERIDAEKNQYDDHARLQTRDEMLRGVEEKWYEPINNKDATSSAQEAQPNLVRATNFGLDQELKSIFLSLDFTNATIEEATNFLSIESKRLDPAHKGINFIIQPEASTTAKPVTIALNNVPLGEALRYVCQLANVKFKVQDYAISIVPFTSNTDDLVSRTFVVQPNFVVSPPPPGTIDSATGNNAATSGTTDRPLPPPVGGAIPGATEEGGGDTVRQALIDKGLKFPPGASAVYTPTTGQLTVVDTADQMELLEELVNAGQAPTLMVRIATKFVEINQQDLNDLTSNVSFNLFNPVTGVSTGPGAFLTTPQFSTALPGALGFTPDSIDQLINPQAPLPNSLAIRTFLNATQFNLLITALSQKRSFDLLSEPAVLTKSGEQGVLEAVRVFPYPISFDPPTLVTQTNTGTVTDGTAIVAFTPPVVIATTPTDFKRRNVGVRLVIKPQVTADNKTVDLSLFPEVTDFEGFINYGSAIFVPNPDGSINPITGTFATGNATTLLSFNQINQPVFNTRRINTKVLVRDGATVVLGGLIRDDIQNVNDKVPLLGDIPLIGRLFQSKAITNTKRNLIIFVTANIYRNDGELLNPPEVSNTADILTGHAGFTAPATP